MNFEAKLRELIEIHKGIILTKDVEEAGIPRHYLTILVRKNELERIYQGIYITPETFFDEMYCIQLRSEKIVFSSETALFIHDLTDKDPLLYSVTVPRDASKKRLRSSGINVTTVKPEVHSIGITTTKTIYGREIQVYDVERTICDIIKHKNKMNKDMFYMALKRYSARTDKDLRRLMKYANQLAIEKKVTMYMEGFLI